MEEKIRLGNLYDVYGILLTEHQRQIFELFVCEDLSLGEIAEQEGISRQGVHDLVRRCSRQMEEYERRLHLLEQDTRRRKALERMRTLARALPDAEKSSTVSETASAAETGTDTKGSKKAADESASDIREQLCTLIDRLLEENEDGI